MRTCALSLFKTYLLSYDKQDYIITSNTNKQVREKNKPTKIRPAHT